jgi:thiol-disulfide isomerase/thioredoxin
MKRRLALGAAAAGALAAALGAGINRWRTEPGPADGGSAVLFAATFPDVDGRPQPLAQWRGRTLLVNFWATWCPPCVEEMPDLQQIRDSYAGKGVEVLGIGIDNAARIAEFRGRYRISLPLLVAGAGGSELNRALGNASGALPFTVLVDGEGRIRERHLGQVRPEQLRRWLDALVASP